MATDLVEVDGHTLKLSNLEKVMYPKTGFTKGQVIDYYARIAPAILPHLRGRPLSLKRYPNGVEGGFFYQKSCPPHRPKWLPTVPVWSEGRGEDIIYCKCEELADLVWLANMANLELHTFLARGKTIQNPTMMVYDLDPGAPAGLLECCEVAVWVRDELKDMGLRSLVKVSGSKGMQLYVPINTPTTYDVTKPLSRMIAERLSSEHPGKVTANMRKDLRKGKIFIDWSQNDEHKTTVCVYSLRGTPNPQVSVPLTWDEVEEALANEDASPLWFSPDQAIARYEEQGDLFKDVLTRKQRLPSLGA